MIEFTMKPNMDFMIESSINFMLGINIGFTLEIPNLIHNWDQYWIHRQNNIEFVNQPCWDQN
jgi:hypothetical protein